MRQGVSWKWGASHKALSAVKEFAALSHRDFHFVPANIAPARFIVGRF